MGDAEMENFLSHWDFIVDNMEEAVTDNVKRDLIYVQMNKSKALAEDMAHFRRQVMGHPDRTYEYLRRSIERHLENTKQEKNRLDRANAFKQGKGRNLIPGLAAPEGHPKGKKKGKGRGKRRGRSQSRGAGGGGGQSTDQKPKSEIICYFFQLGECTNKPCSFKHKGKPTVLHMH